MSAPRGYNSYRGRNPLWKKFAAAALILVILLSAVVIALQDRIVYDGSGTPHLALPGGKGEVSTDKTPVAPDELDITVEEAPAVKELLRGALLPETEFSDWDEALLDTLESQNSPYNAVAVTAKTASGRVYYTSEAGQTLSASGTEILSQLTAGEDNRVIARLTCFLDPRAANRDVEGMGLKNTGGYLFYDGNNANWLDPAKPAARQYLVAMASELAALGVDEILLAEVSYPTVGKIDKIDYGEALKPAAIADFLREMQTALEGTEVTLSLELPAQTILAGSDPVAGIVLEDLAPLVSRIYAAAEAEDVPALEQAVQAASETTAFVPVVTDSTDLEGSWLLVM